MSHEQESNRWKVHRGDCRAFMAQLPECSIDAIVSDPPYGFAFMGAGWDHGVPGEEYWEAALRVAKPGCHMLAFGGARTYHRLAVAIEDAGWEIRDCLMWVYGTGFPKSHDVSKAIDKAAGAQRQIIEKRIRKLGGGATYSQDAWTKKAREEGFDASITAPETEEAKRWQGWGTALKPAWEPIVLARKPLSGTVAANVLEYGTGGINVDGCRVAAYDGENRARPPRTPNAILGGGKGTNLTASEHNDAGRWPANLIHDGSDEVVGLFPQQTSGANPTRRNVAKFQNTYGDFAGQEECTAVRGVDSGSAARFFYCAKASATDRDEGLDSFPIQTVAQSNEAIAKAKRGDSIDESDCRLGGVSVRHAKNVHPCVKPTSLMRYLCRLITPPGGLILDPFTGSGSTGKAAVLEGFRFVGMELDPDNKGFVEIARARIAAVARQPRQPDLGMLDD